MENDFDYILTNLKIISLVKINEKVSIYKGYLQIDYTALQCIKRWFNKDSRESLLIFLDDLIKRIKDIFKENNQEQICAILNEIDKIQNGINNLKITYTNDVLTIVKLDTISTRFKSLSSYGRTILIN
jgi:hydrogenase maturation factor HypE